MFFKIPIRKYLVKSLKYKTFDMIFSQAGNSKELNLPFKVFTFLKVFALSSVGLFKANVWRLVYGKIYSIHSYLFLKFEAFTSRNSSAIKIKSCWEVFSLRAKFFLELARRRRVAAWGIKISFRFQNWSFNNYVEKLRPHFKVHVFWEGHKILRNLPITFDRMYYSQI